MSTGGSFTTRRLHTDAEEVLLTAQRPVILTGIGELATRSDLLDRSILIELPRIADQERKPEAELWLAFERARPRMLAALLNTVSGALRALPVTRLAKIPRMADFAKRVTAAETELAWEAGTFVRAYAANRRAAHDVAIESSPLAECLLSLAKRDRKWSGTASELLVRLRHEANQNGTAALIASIASCSRTKRGSFWGRGISGRRGGSSETKLRVSVGCVGMYSLLRDMFSPPTDGR